ncbi:SRPBCC family protein [Microbulbifer sp. TYP-18]|uniref:SRPBCC family protein n=1 Tax=Microbulbifer sp. TYP-18 TaxID=3230024 RepID=UPI0034C6921D
MNFDIEHHLGCVERSVADLQKEGKPARAVTLSRSYDTDIDDLWDALTTAERIPRWFLPIEGDLRLGGRYQFKGNAGGEISECEPPKYLSVTWIWQGNVSWVHVQLAAQGDNRTRLTLTHTAIVDPFWDQYGPGATGIGWELGLAGLALHLIDPKTPKIDEEVFAQSPEGKAFMQHSASAWGEADIARGEDPAQAEAASKRTAGFYTGETSQQD